jgi:hypothetical protein
LPLTLFDTDFVPSVLLYVDEIGDILPLPDLLQVVVTLFPEAMPIDWELIGFETLLCASFVIELPFGLDMTELRLS